MTLLTPVTRLALLAAFLWTACLQLTAAPAQAGPFRDREIDVVFIQGAQIESLLGKPIANLRLYAVQEGALAPIPFQIDERNEDGEYVLSAGRKKSKDEDKGLLDANDELVFLAADMGPQRAAAHGLPRASQERELVLRDPINGEQGYAYLFFFGAAPPPPSATDYVTYDPPSDITYTRGFTMGFDPKYRFAINLLGRPRPHFDPKANPVDILKIRMDATIFGFHVTRHQEDFNTKLAGWIDGPIRVIKWTGMNMRVIAFVRSPRIWNYTFFYPNSFSYDFGIKTPVAIPRVAGRLDLHAGMDFSNLRGAEIYGSGFERPYVVTGTPGDPAIAKINENPDRNDFFAVKWEGVWWLCRIRFPSNVPLEPGLYLTDDAGLADPPENTPGAVPGVYFRLSNWMKVYEKDFMIRNFVIVTDRFTPGSEGEFFARQDRPVFLVDPPAQ